MAWRWRESVNQRRSTDRGQCSSWDWSVSRAISHSALIIPASHSRVARAGTVSSLSFYLFLSVCACVRVLHGIAGHCNAMVAFTTKHEPHTHLSGCEKKSIKCGERVFRATKYIKCRCIFKMYISCRTDFYCSTTFNRHVNSQLSHNQKLK